MVRFLFIYSQPCFRGATWGPDRRAQDRDLNEASVAPSQATLTANPSTQNSPLRPPHFRPQSGDKCVYPAWGHGLPQLSSTDD